jgi:hypothetical protein
VLLLRAALLVGRLLEAPPKALPLRLDELELGMLRLPTRSPPPALVPAPLRLLVPRLFDPGDARFAPVVPALVPVRLAGCARGVSPRAVPP